ncbi:MAG: right-handed parallel beta-helix repeat-containing protein, partial [Clostridia bacterium]|nr:right-handed parallel beta-helix repeat-containing protein [Clostridia bacterium]
ELYMKGAKCGGMIIAAVYNGTVRNCRVLDCATAQDSAYAPLWIRHSDRITVEYCEIAGSTNKTDGMAVDFDGWTTNCTYRYIYSHDNTRFMKNCVFDCKTKNAGNCVYNCVSVNDNKKMNWAAISLVSLSRPSFGRMADFTFRDNWIINGKPIFWLCTEKPQAQNIKFMSTPTGNFFQKLFNLFISPDNFTYVTPEHDVLEARIGEITANLSE